MKKFNIWLLLLLFFCGLAPASQSQAHTPPVQPLLLAMSQAQPNGHLKIIVQKLTTDQRLEALVETLGGVVTLDLSIINAFAAEVPASAVPTLAAATGVKWISYDAPMIETGGPDGRVSTTNLRTVYNRAIRADQLWAQGYQGSTVGVAVIDSGIDRWAPDLSDHVSVLLGGADWYGHGTHVAGIIAGNGASSRGKYIGVAPKAKLFDVSFASRDGQITTSYFINAIQLILQYKSYYDIRVVNLSFNSTVAESYLTSPLNAAIEILWFNGIVVVVSAGNNGTATLYPPANDPFVITVGATDDKGTASIADDTVAPFSAYGTTPDGFAKPDLVAPGRHIVSLLAPSSAFQADHPGNIVDTTYFRMSGTSAAAPMVAGAVALLLQAEPNLTPDQVKYRLMATANKNWPNYNGAKAGAGYLDVYAAVHGATTQSANTGIRASRLLWTGTTPATWGSVSWNSVSWNSVSWNSVSWNSVSWNSVSWNSDYWEDGTVSSAAANASESLADDNLTVVEAPVSTDPAQETSPANADQSSAAFKILLPLVAR
ncbi:MAG: S8 family peptidase [Caldilineaceae bacterium]